MQPEPDLFQVKFNEEGKRFIRKFAAISYTMMILVIFESAVSIYWSVRVFIIESYPFTSQLYNRVFPYISILFALTSLFSNFYFLRFPRILLRRLELNDEEGANRAFSVLFKAALIFLLYLFLQTANIIWSLVSR